MKLPLFAFVFGILFSTSVVGQTDLPLVLKTKTGNIDGTLLLPTVQFPVPVALIIAGSGPTDRDGNNPVMTNNSLKMLATELAKKGIASLRYDKRGIGKSQQAGLSEKDLRFENYIEDATAWIDQLKNDMSFNQIVVIGHSEGALIGAIASQSDKVDKFVSIAGAGKPASQVLTDQLKEQPKMIAEQSQPIIDELVKGNTVETVPPILNSLFRTSVQPYLISWFKYDPRIEIGKLKKPVLVVQGTADIQVGIGNANMLHDANPDSKLVLIDGMNHILKNSDTDRTKNMLTYRNPMLPVNEVLIDSIANFILSKQR